MTSVVELIYSKKKVRDFFFSKEGTNQHVFVARIHFAYPSNSSDIIECLIFFQLSSFGTFFCVKKCLDFDVLSFCFQYCQGSGSGKFLSNIPLQCFSCKSFTQG